MVAKKILIIRHGEKDIGEEDNHLLSEKGYERAEALKKYFTEKHEIIKLFEKYPLAGVFAQGVDPEGEGKSLRPIETVQPLINHLTSLRTQQSNFFTPTAKLLQKYPKKDTQKMIDRILNSEEYTDKTVIISWSHKGIVDLAKQLGAKNVPEKWKGKRFDVTWLIGEDKVLKQFPQLLLAGDLDTVLK